MRIKLSLVSRLAFGFLNESELILTFLNPKKPDSDISPAHISTWIKKLVQDAHEHTGVEHLHLAKVSAHDVWKCAASWAAFNGAPCDEIIQAAYWKSQTSFTSFYLKAMVTQAEGLFALGPIVAAQTVIQPPCASSDEEEGLHPAVPFLPSEDWVRRLLPTLYEECFCWVFVLTLSARNSVLA